MLFYESAKCLHGRRSQLKGKYYGSIFVHYQPVDPKIWNYSVAVRESVLHGTVCVVVLNFSSLDYMLELLYQMRPTYAHTGLDGRFQMFVYARLLFNLPRYLVLCADRM
jgi:hypothetical protein